MRTPSANPFLAAGLLLAVAVVLPLAAAQARIGETVAEVERRYGQPIGDPPPRLAKRYATAEATRIYHQSGLVIFVAYLHGKSAAEFFVHGNASPLTDPEINDLLAANRGEAGTGWKQLDLGSPADGTMGWSREDGLVVASGNTDHKSLEILERNFWEGIAKVEDHPLPGF